MSFPERARVRMEDGLPVRELETSAPDSGRNLQAVSERPLTFAARDGYPLGATLYAPGTSQPVGVVVFSAGGGTAAERYAHFLRFVAKAGYAVLAYDYRGVGASAPLRRAGFDAGIEDWAALDQPAAVDFVRGLYPAATLSCIAHSIGSVVAVASPNSTGVDQFVLVAPHTGYHGDYRTLWRWPMLVTWHVFMPLVARLLGYFPASRLGLGDDIPKRMALQWAYRTPDGLPPSVMRDADRQRILDNARALFAPMLLLTLADDAFVGDAACSRFVATLPNARFVRRHLEASQLAPRGAGHFGFFRRRNAAVWGIVTNFLATPWRRGDRAR